MHKALKAPILLFIFTLSLLTHNAPAHAMEQQPAATPSTSSWLQRHSWEIAKSIGGLAAILALILLPETPRLIQQYKEKRAEKAARNADAERLSFQSFDANKKVRLLATNATFLQYITDQNAAGEILFAACSQGSLSVVQLLLKKYPDLLWQDTYTTESQPTRLYYGAQALKIAEQGIDHKNWDSRYPYTEPHYMIRDYLLDYIHSHKTPHCNLKNCEDHQGFCSAIMRMALDENLSHLVEALYDHGIIDCINQDDKNKFLFRAIDKADIAQMDAWLRVGANPTAIDRQTNYPALIYALKQENNGYAMAHRLLTHDPLLAQKKSQWSARAPLEQLIVEQDFKNMKWLLTLPIKQQPLPDRDVRQIRKTLRFHTTVQNGRPVSSTAKDIYSLYAVWKNFRTVNIENPQNWVKMRNNMQAHLPASMFPHVRDVALATLPHTLTRSLVLAALKDIPMAKVLDDELNPPDFSIITGSDGEHFDPMAHVTEFLNLNADLEINDKESAEDTASKVLKPKSKNTTDRKTVAKPKQRNTQAQSLDESDDDSDGKEDDDEKLNANRDLTLNERVATTTFSTRASQA